jgi:nitrite reductase/ring-hydroxylating ferredoxin subunit
VNAPTPGPAPLATSQAAVGQALCASSDLVERGRAWVWDLLLYGRPARAFALRADGQLRAYINRCVHVPTEMDWQPGEFWDSEQRFIICSIHGATYEPVEGRCVGGPCGRGKLTAVAVAEQGGQVCWYPSVDIQPVPLPAPSPSANP